MRPLIYSMLVLAMSVVAFAGEKKPIDEILVKEPLPKSYSLYTPDGDTTFNYTPNLGGFSFHGLHLRVWMTADRAVLSPGDNLSLTVHYQNISAKQIWVPDPVEWSLHGYADIKSGATSLSRSSLDPHSMPKKLKAGERSSFKIELDSPIDEEGFLQIDLSWGIEEEIEPNPITVECREQEHIEQNAAEQPASRPAVKNK